MSTKLRNARFLDNHCEHYVFVKHWSVKVGDDWTSEYKPLILSLDPEKSFQEKMNQEAVGFLNSFDSSCGR